MPSVQLKGAGPTQTLSVRVARALRPTVGDLLAVVSYQQARILKRTEQGVDYQGKAFAPYSTKGPYYFYPAGPAGRIKGKAGARARVTRFGKQGPSGRRTRSGFGLRFASYAAFKHTFLGRSTVDLRGARAPHMLQQIAMQVGGQAIQAGLNPRAGSATELTTPARTASLGIYGEAGARASGHNEGTRRLPQRRFFDASDQDLAQAAELLADRAQARLLKALE